MARHPDAPKTRADCIGGPRPCPWIGCKHHLWLPSNARHRRALEDMPHTCVLDITDEHPDGADTATIAEALGLSEGWVRAVEHRILGELAEMLEDEKE